MHLKRLFLSSVVAFSLHVPACLGMDLDEMPRMDFDKTPRIGFDEMPADVRKLIVGFLDWEGKKSAALACKGLRDLIYGGPNQEKEAYVNNVINPKSTPPVLPLHVLEQRLGKAIEPNTGKTYLELAQQALREYITAKGMISAIRDSEQEKALLCLEGVRLVNLLGLRQGSHPNPKNPEEEAAIYCFLNERPNVYFCPENASEKEREKILNSYDEALKAFVEDVYPGYAFYDEQKDWSKDAVQATYLVITDTQLRRLEVRNALRVLSQAHPSLKFAIDVEEDLDPDLLSLGFIKHLVLTNTRGNLEEIPYGFGRSAQVETANFLLPKVTKVGNRVFSSSSHLISLSGLPNVREVGGEFCLNCPLTQLSLPRLKEVDSWFLSGCRSLSRFFAPRLEKAGDYFLFGCPLGRFFAPRLEKAGSFFLAHHPLSHNCFLTQLSLPRLKEAGSRFLCNVSSLRHFLSPRLEKAGDSFLSSCSSLNEAFFPRLEEAGSCFLSSCSSLNEAFFPRLEEAGSCFLSSCSSLNQLFAPCLKKIEGRPFDDCDLTTLQLSQTVRLTRVRNSGTPVISNVIKIGGAYFSYEPSANPEEIERLKKLLIHAALIG